MIYFLTNSVGYDARKEGKSFMEILSRELLSDVKWFDYHTYLYTAIGVNFDSQKFIPKSDDIVILNFGINDCIFRKDKDIQIKGVQALLDNSIKNNDVEGATFLTRKFGLFKEKGETDLLQLITYDEFRNYLDKIFSKVGKRTIVLSINWIVKSDVRIGWAYNEIVETNKILCQKSQEYGLVFVDLFEPPDKTFDGTHFTEMGHKWVADKLRPILKSFYQKV